MERTPHAGTTRRRAIAVGAGVAALSAIAVLLMTLYGRESSDAARERRGPPGARELDLESDTVEPGPPLAGRSAARDSTSREASAAASLALRGRVLDSKGAPVAGAAVEAAPERPETPERSAASQRTASTTLADGSFALHVEDDGDTYQLLVVADGFFPAFVDALVSGGAPVVVRLRATPSLVGSVRTTAGQTVAGARVRLLARTSSGERLELETHSTESGHYRLSGGLLDLEHLDAPLLEASAVGFAPSRVHLRDFAFLLTRAPALEVLERDVVLSPGNRFAGQVRDESGAPVAGAELVVFTHAGRGLFTDDYGTLRSSGLGPTAIATTRSGPDGGFVLEALPVRTGDGAEQGSMQDDGSSMGSVRAHAEGYALGGARLPWTNEGETTAPLEIVLLRSATFSGRVVDLHGNPLAEAKVGIQLRGAALSTMVPNGMLPDGFGDLLYWSPAQEDTAGYLWVRTGADGRFQSPALPCARAGEAHVRIELDWRGDRADWREIELRAHERRQLGDLVLTRHMVQVPIEGAVLEPDGAPVAGAEVHLQDAGMHRTDRDGRFRFEHRIAPEHAFPSLDLEVRARGFVTHREVLSAAPTGPLEVRLATGVELRGTLSFEGGAPAARGRIRFERPRQPGRGSVWSDMIGWTGTDDLGRFVFTELPAPPWVVTFGVDRNGFALEGQMTLHEPQSDVALVLPGVLPDFASLELGVTDSGGRPIDSVRRAGLENGSGSVESLRRDARTFVFPEVAPGRYELKLGAPGFAAHSQALVLAPGERARVDVTLEAGARVSVRVTPPPSSLTHLRVVAVSAEHQTRSGALEQDGVAELSVLAHGSWTLGLVAQGLDSGAPQWLGPTKALEVPVGTALLEWNLERPELGRVRLELPVHSAEDSPIPADADPAAVSGSLAASDRIQAWWSAYHRYVQRAKELTLELQDDAGVVLVKIALEEVMLDAQRNRVLGAFTATIGHYTLVLRRDAQLLRRTPVQVLPDSTVELDP
jgi:hypothetical protein